MAKEEAGKAEKSHTITENVNTWINVNKEDKIRDYVERWIKGKPV